MNLRLAAITMMATLSIYAQEISNDSNTWSAGRPDGHVPISVMGDHMHSKGEWMVSYRYMKMNMNDLREGLSDTSTDKVLADYMVTPIKMPMGMHMLGVMYAPSNRLTLTAMLHTVALKMDHLTHMGESFTTKSSGLGDLKVSGMYRFFNQKHQVMHGRLGFSIPVGSVNEKDVTPASAPKETVLPYPMQLGSGTLDADLALTYLLQGQLFSYGAQLSSTLRVGENSREYSYGNEFQITCWAGMKLTDWLGASAKIEQVFIGGIKGEDPHLNPMMVPTADIENSGGNLLHSGLGFNLYAPSGDLTNLRLGIEYGFPLHQRPNGIQLKRKQTLTLGLQYSI